MQSPILFYCQWLMSILSVPANGVCGMPLIILLGLVAGRRGRGRLCLDANRALLLFALIVSPIVPAHILGSYLLQILPIMPDGGDWAGPLFTSAGFSFLSSIICGLLGSIALLFAFMGLRIPYSRPLFQDRYTLKYIRKTLIWCLVAAIFYIGVFWLINWPFAGAPPGMESGRLFMVIGRNAMHAYFTTFAPAGCMALVCSTFYGFTGMENKRISVRWLACWAGAGYLPQTITALGLIIGVAVRGEFLGALSMGLSEQIWVTGATAIFILCCAKLVWGKKSGKGIIWFLFILLLFRASAHFICNLARVLPGDF